MAARPSFRVDTLDRPWRAARLTASTTGLDNRPMSDQSSVPVITIRATSG
jgi:hypothetical protein